ncbi:MAG: hypothetical protein ACLQVI_43345 [Polyangiaceae bacterium]|jgi:hypothetical protein
MLHTAQLAATYRLHVKALAERRRVLVDPFGRARLVPEDDSEVPLEGGEQRGGGEFAPSSRRERRVVEVAR